MQSTLFFIKTLLSNLFFLLPKRIIIALNYQNLKQVLISFWTKIIFNFKKINVYYVRNEHIWLDGFLFDFLQKKTADI